MASATDAATETNTIIMQNYCKTIGALAAASALVAGTAKAELEYSISGGYHKEYIFRGVELGDTLQDYSLEITGFSYAGLDMTAGVWNAFFLDGSGDNQIETDLYLDASRDLGVWGLTGSVGYIWYVNDDNDDGQKVDDAQEIYFGLSKELGYGISADLTYYWDVETDNDGYIELGFSKSYDLSDCMSLGLDTRIGYAYEEGEFANWSTTASLDWAFAESATLSPYVLLVVDGSANDLYETANNTELVAGASLSVSF